MVRIRGAPLLAALALALAAAGCRAAAPSAGLPSLRSERDRAVAGGYEWLARFLDDPRHVDALGVDAVRIFAEPAATMPDAVSRARWRGEARRKARCFGMLRMRPDVPLASFDLLDVLEYASHAPDLGLDPARLLSRARTVAAAREDAPFEVPPPERLPDLSAQDLLDTLLGAYSLERAALAGAIPRPADGLGGILRFLLGRRYETDPGSPLFREDVYLAAHVGFVASDYGRVRLRRTDAPAVFDYLFFVWPDLLAAGDVELVAEVADVARSLGLSEEDDPLLHAATRFLLDARRANGDWGPGPDEDSPYGVMHPTWCATGGLRERLFLAGTPFEARIRSLLAGAGR